MSDAYGRGGAEPPRGDDAPAAPVFDHDAEPEAFPTRPSLDKRPSGESAEPAAEPETTVLPTADPAAEPDAFGPVAPDVREAVTAEVPVVHGTAEMPAADDPGYDPFAPPPQPPPVAPPARPRWSGRPDAPYAAYPGAAPHGYGPYGPYPSYAPHASYAPYQAVPYGYSVPGDMTGAGGPTEDLGRRYGKRLVLWAALVALVAGLIGGGVGAWVADREDTKVRLGEAPAIGPARPKDSIAGLAGSTLPGVVYIHVRTGRGESTGTGFVLDTAGNILTNNHVVESAASGGTISVTFNDGQQTTATLVGRDTGYDLAVVRVSGVQGLHPLPLGNSDGVQVGDPVIAIGAPFNLEGTVTSGIISAKDRAVSAGTSGSDVSYISALQTDAPINPGNSGGPLIDASGAVVGINSAIRSAGGGQGNPFGTQQEAGSIGLGFAIPINQGRRVAQQLIDTGKASHPVIGVSLDIAYQGDGARIATEDVKGTPPIRSGGPAERAGLKPGDVIKAIDGRRVHDANELIVAIRSKAPGAVAKITIERDGAERTVDMTLEAG
ncbi:trypsin-like peptidase domain-containing protein [Embleya sp. NBC_00896]|uniref:S1C family serine protease n=1 Tax=Embleya sp. NBC_00896 TaxID=2975961 RepID=UPI003865AA92|nr:trypsin-like peptidase domain-containing protein [Embleya sp. NBC_00896]